MMSTIFSRMSLALALLVLPFQISQAAGGYQIELETIKNDIRDQTSLQRGAEHFANYCMACHSISYIRYNRIARDLGWENEEVVAKMTFDTALPVDMAETRMLPDVSQAVFGTKVPDLSLMARLKGNDYIYNFIRGYYLEEDGAWNNKMLEGTSMPNVLEAVKRQNSEQEYDQMTYDLVNFLDYVAEPSKIQRWDLGWKVIAFLLVLLLLTYLLKREYWKDIK